MLYLNSPAWPGMRMAALVLLVVWPLLSLPLPQTAAQSAIPLRANGKIAFTSDRDGNREIYVMNADGTNQVRLTNNPLPDDYPTWSPDGTKIAFVSQEASSGFALCFMNGDGTNKIEVSPINDPNLVGLEISWSPDGSRIAFQHDGDIFVVNVDGSNQHNLTNSAEREASPSWSPDGSRIAFQYDYDIFVINADGSNRQNLTNSPEHDHYPLWSPDGSKILFSRDSLPQPSFHTIKPDGTDLRALPDGSKDGFGDGSPKWSPTGDKITFLVNVWDFHIAIFTASADGTNRQHFESCGTFGCGEDHDSPNWSPDGSKIIFSIWDRFRTDGEIYVKNINDRGVERLTNTAGRNFNPSWQPLPVRVIPRSPRPQREPIIRQ